MLLGCNYPRIGPTTKRAEKTHVLDDIEFLTKPQIALVLIDEALADDITVKAWTFDELYGRDEKFLDGLDGRKQAFVGDVPPDFHMWTRKPNVLRKTSRNTPRTGKGSKKKYPRLVARDAKACQVRNLAKPSPGLASQTPQRFRVRGSPKGPAEGRFVGMLVIAKSTTLGLSVRSARCAVHVAESVRTGEVKYFASNRVRGRHGRTHRELLRLAFARWKVEACFREAKEELGWNHFGCRGWGCVHRHLIVAIVSQLFCARVRHKLCPSEVVTDAQRLTLEQIRRADDVVIHCIGLPRCVQQVEYEAELHRSAYHQRRNAEASHYHRTRRSAAYQAMGMEPDTIQRVEPKSP